MAFERDRSTGSSRLEEKKLKAIETIKFGSLLAVLAVICACASSRDTIPAARCPAPETAETEYRIGSGDMLQVVVWRNDELSTSIPVRPDGRISTPLIDDMQASGKTPSELAADMEAVLGEYLRTPDVSVIVTSQGSANQIQAIGEILSPQAVSYRYGLKLLDVVVAVGGLSEFAAGNRANLVRTVNNNQVKCRVKLDDLLKGDITQNIDMYPGDMLVVPETRF